MLSFRLSITNPFGVSDSNRDFFYFDKKLTENKSFECQVTHFGFRDLFEFSIDLSWRGSDHAGPFVELTILGLFMSARVYDGRHWNHDANRWMTDDEAAREYGDLNES